MVRRIFNSVTNKIYVLPILVLMPHSRCNCKCIMCDIWKANSEKRELTVEDIQKHLFAFKNFQIERIALSGGEALMHSNLWLLCRQLKSFGAKITLLSTGLSLKKNASEILTHCDDVVVSLDGNQAIHNQIRNIPRAFEKLREGVHEIKALNPTFKITGRCVIQKSNFHDFENIVNIALEIGLDQISFLPADVSSTSFNRPQPWESDKIDEVSLTLIEIEQLEESMKNSFTRLAHLYKARFIAETPTKMLQIVQHYRALLGLTQFPKKKCNAPWMSAVIESNGDVLPCFFHKPYGNIYEENFSAILNSHKAVSFRKNLTVTDNPVCKKCVCSIYLNPLRSI